uniref:Ig-like domain-containing protein n=1 Tax=Otus sunia TaxID=257818 RepID=A0A8C8AUI5_9STRI
PGGGCPPAHCSWISDYICYFAELHAWELDSLSVQCKYSAWMHSTDVKVWCRNTQTGCKVVVRTDYPSAQRNSKALEDRTLIQDDSQRRTVTITMHKLQAQDTGVYWCGETRLVVDSRLTFLLSPSAQFTPPPVILLMCFSAQTLHPCTSSR